jgi:hypothetical protein
MGGEVGMAQNQLFAIILMLVGVLIGWVIGYMITKGR